jgi:sugar O-acyltransferase (sialic acid O-acetyltransferase NeuD family)
MREKLIVIGAATPTIIRVVDDLAQAGRAIEIVGFLDNAYQSLGKSFFGFEILGGFDAIQKFRSGDVVLINTIAGTIANRVETTEHFLTRGYRFTNVTHPGVNTHYVTMGTGNLIYENALIQPFVTIGNHCVISSNSGIAHESSVGDYCFVGPASYICGKVVVEEKVYIGTGSKILPRLKIGKGAHVGPGALVHKSIADGQRVMGTAARAI